MPVLPPLDYQVSFDDSSVEVIGDGSVLKFELGNPEEIDRFSAVFAAWVLLPIAMVKGRDIRIHGGGDAVTERNFEKLTEFWSTLMPERFQSAKVFFTKRHLPEKAVSDCDLLLFSGGVDSTYNLLLRHEAKMKQTLLTIHGLDYKADDRTRFELLSKKIEPLVQLTGSRQIFLKTNAYTVYRQYQIGIDVGHVFVLAASLFLCGANYREVEISADISAAQEYLLGPWGTNSYTNPFFQSSSLKLNTANLDVTRAEKLPLIRRYPVALGALSFCKDYSFRPENCGVCSKCARTKAMFLAWSNEIPPIFCDQSIPPRFLEKLDDGEGSRLFLADIYNTAQRNGMLHNFPGAKERLIALSTPQRKKKISKAEIKNLDAKITKERPWYRRVFPIPAKAKH